VITSRKAFPSSSSDSHFSVISYDGDFWSLLIYNGAILQRFLQTWQARIDEIVPDSFFYEFKNYL